MRLEREIRIDAPRDLLWPLIADTDRLNREVRLPPVHYEHTPLPTGGADVLARANPLPGVVVRWREFPFEWSAPSFYRVRREFENGPIRWLEAGSSLEEDGAGTRVRTFIDYEPRGLFSRLLAKVTLANGLDAMTAVCRQFEAYLQKRATRAFSARAGRDRANLPLLDSLTGALRLEGYEEEMVRRLADHLRESPEEEVVAMRPFVLAERWAFDRTRLVELFLDAAKAGLLELRWVVLCPGCRGFRKPHDHLDGVRRHASCETCAIDFPATFDESVEARFDVHPAVRTARLRTYCAGGPGNTPHRVAQAILKPGESRTIELRLVPGSYRLVSPQAKVPAALRVGTAEGGARELTAEIDAARILAGASDAAPGPLRLRVVNRLGHAATLRVETAGASAAIVSAATVTSLQKFRDLFSAECLAPGEELSLGRLAFLFSDLQGSTALYERIGDPAAFGLVKRHFNFMQERIRRHHGAVVKTMGDAVMAVFHDPRDAVRCAAEIQQDADEGRDLTLIRSVKRSGGAEIAGEAENAETAGRIPVGGRGVGIKVGLHIGPCLAIAADGVIDYFGTTVNLAQRIQSESRAGEVVLSVPCAREGDAESILDGRRWTRSEETVRPKGFSEPLVLHRYARR